MSKCVVWLACASVALATGCSDPNASARRQVDEGPAPETNAASAAEPVAECSRESTDCYFNGERNVVLEEHPHRPGCGHAWDGEHWLAVVPCNPLHEDSHRCTVDCQNHYRHHDKIVSIYGHKHAAGCGHLWDDENWLRIAKPHEDPNHPDFGKTPEEEERAEPIRLSD